MKPLLPELTKLPKRTVLTITAVGNPNSMGPVFQALYGTAYGTKFKVFKPKGKKMEIGQCSALWPDAHLKPKSKWTGVWHLEVPMYVKNKDLIQKNPQRPVSLTIVPAGTFAQVLYVGLYTKEHATIVALHTYIDEQGYKIIGDHEEVYLTKPGPKAKTIIRYRVAKTVRRKK